MLAANTPKLRIVADEISELAALLHQVAARETRDALLESADTHELAQHDAGILEAQRLIEIRGDQVVFER
jgi:hypothetical protein